MKNFLKGCFAWFIALSLPLQGQNYYEAEKTMMCEQPNYYQPNFQAPTQSSRQYISQTGLAIGAVVLGAAAGAGAGYAAGSRNKCKSSKGCETTCPNLCLCRNNEGEELNFNITVNFTISDSASTEFTCTPVIVTSQGCEIRGTTNTFSTNMIGEGTCTVEDFIISNPPYGNHNVGIEIQIDSGIVITGADIEIAVTTVNGIIIGYFNDFAPLMPLPRAEKEEKKKLAEVLRPWPFLFQVSFGLPIS